MKLNPAEKTLKSGGPKSKPDIDRLDTISENSFKKQLSTIADPDGTTP